MRVEYGSQVIELGATETTPTIGITDFSRREVDDFGVTTVVRRGFARTLSVRMAMPTTAASAVQQTLTDLRATPVRWLADDRFDWLSATGFYRDFSIDHAAGALSFCTLSVVGLAEDEAAADSGADPATDGKASTFRVLDPIAITDAVLTSSSVPENDHPAWSAGTTYAVGARVIVTATHRVYESLVAANVGSAPAASPEKWLDVGPTNRWAMFDQALGTATTANGSITVTLAGSQANALALLDVGAASVRVLAPGYDRTIAVAAGPVAFLDLPPSDSTISVSINGAGVVSVGTLLLGRLTGLGVTEASPSSGINDFSVKETDQFGDVTVVERAWAKRLSANTLIRTNAIDDVAGRIAAKRARPVLWIADEGTDALIAYGFWKDFSIEVGPSVSKVALSIEGLSKAAPILPAPPVVVDWPNVADPTGTKPADNATEGAPAGTNVGGVRNPDGSYTGGRPAQEVIAQIDRIEPIVVKTDLLKHASLDQAAILRQAQAAQAKIGEALLRLTTEADRNRAVLRDAGITVDPVTGKVRIHAIDQVAERTSIVETLYDAVNAQVRTKASVALVQQLITEAAIDPSQIAELQDIFTRLTSAETGIDGLLATVVSKADALTVSNLVGTINSVSDELDALAGTVTTKASNARVDGIDTRVGATETQLLSIGDTSSFSVTVRQARLAADGAAEAGLRALLAGDEASRRQLVQASQARTELFAKIIDGDSAEAAQRALLTVKIGQAEGRLATEIAVRIEQNRVMSEAITAMQAVQGALSADITDIRQAIVDGDTAQATARTQLAAALRGEANDKDAAVRALVASERDASIDRDGANATAIEQVSARFGDLGGVTVQQKFQAVATSLGEIEGKYTVAIDANGNLIGFELIGGPSGPGSFNLINTDLRMGTGRVIFNNGSVMRVQGTGFGVNADLISWFGPSMAIANCSRANAVSYEATNGDAYFGGSLSAGIIKNAVRTTVTAADATVTTGEVTSNGGQRTVVVSYIWTRSASQNSAQPEGSGAASAVIRLLRGGVEIATLNATGDWQRTSYGGPGSPATYDETIGGSITVNDNSGGVRVTYTAQIVSRTLGPGPSGVPAQDAVTQSLSIVQTEE